MIPQSLLRQSLLRLATLFLLSGLALGGCLNVQSGASPAFREVLLQGEGKAKILMIDITGVIHNGPLLVPNVGVLPGMVARIRQELEIAYQDPDIGGLLLRINSPGGTLTDSDVIYHSLIEFKKSKKVKIIASFGDIAASGAVYVAMAADEIYAHPTTITGSIGVIIPHVEYSELMRRMGVRSNPVTSGQYKDFDSPYRERSTEEQRILQELVNAQHEKFVQVVDTGRPKMTRDQVKKIADGRIFSAQDAQKDGLIDGVGYLDDAYKRLSELSGFPRNRLVRYANSWLTGNNIYTNTFPIEIVPN